MIISFLSTVASMASSFFLKLSSKTKNDTPEASFKMWFVAMTLQKLMGCTIAYFLYKDWKVKPREPEDAIRLSDIRVSVLQGRGLVAKDKNIWGRHISSDPYVVLRHGPNMIGRTSIIKKTLDPTWNDQSFRLHVVRRSIAIYNSIECRIFDHDNLSNDDPMGTVFVPIPPLNNSKVLRWFAVEKGEGENHCRNATGELLIEIEVRSRLAESFKRQLQSQSTRLLCVEKDE